MLCKPAKRIFLALLLSFMTTGSLLPMQQKNLQTLSTANFRIMYGKKIPVGEVREIGKALENQYAIYRKKLGLDFAEKVEVLVYNTAGLFPDGAKSKLFDDACANSGIIYFSYPAFRPGKNDLQAAAGRVVARTILGGVPYCPEWLAEAYALYAGNDLKRFGKPVHTTASNYEDLGEDYARAERLVALRSMFAILASTSEFIVDTYGEKRYDAVFLEFSRGSSLAEAFEKAFGVKLPVIERAWLDALQAASK